MSIRLFFYLFIGGKASLVHCLYKFGAIQLTIIAYDQFSFSNVTLGAESPKNLVLIYALTCILLITSIKCRYLDEQNQNAHFNGFGKSLLHCWYSYSTQGNMTIISSPSHQAQ